MARLLLVLLGLWLGLLLASGTTATVNFRCVDRVLGAGQRPELERALAGVVRADRRAALRHLASEIDRWAGEGKPTCAARRTRAPAPARPHSSA